MKPHRATRVGSAMLFVVAVLATCQKPYHEKTEHFVFIAANINLPYWQEAAAGFKESARVLDVKADFEGPTSYSPEQELKAFQDAVSTHPTGILVSPARADLFKDAIDATLQNGIPVICVDSDSPLSRRVLFIGTDNYLAGIESGNRMTKLLHGRGLVVLITIPGQFNLDERLRGVNVAFKKYPGVQITKTIDDKGDPHQAHDQISTLLQNKQKMDGILCLEASGGPGAAEAVYALGMSGKIPIVAMDKNPDTLDWVKRGVISVTIAQKPYTMSYYGLKLLDDLHHNVVHQFKDWRTAPTSPLPAVIDTGTATVDDQNVEDFVSALVAHKQALE